MKECAEALVTVRAERAGLRRAADPHDAKQAKVVTEFAPGDESPDLAPEPQTERPHDAFAHRAFGIAVADQEASRS